MANSVDPDETARNEPSHLDLRCLHRYWFWSVEFEKVQVGIKGQLSEFYFILNGKAQLKLLSKWLSKKHFDIFSHHENTPI